jgi:hypothetical protein
LCGPAKAVSRYLSRAKISGDAACRVSTSKSYSKQAIRREIAFEAGDPAESRDPSLHSGWKTSHTAEGDGKIFAHPRATVPHNCRHNRNFSRGGNSLHQHGSVSILGVPYFCRFAPHRLECNSAGRFIWPLAHRARRAWTARALFLQSLLRKKRPVIA